MRLKSEKTITPNKKIKKKNCAVFQPHSSKNLTKLLDEFDNFPFNFVGNNQPQRFHEGFLSENHRFFGNDKIGKNNFFVFLRVLRVVSFLFPKSD